MIKPLDIHLDTEAGLATDIPPEQACLRVTTETGALRSPSHSCVLPPSNLVSSAPCCVGRAACPRCESGAKSLSPRPPFGLGNAPALPSLLAKPVAFVLAAKLQTCVPLPTLLKPLGVGAPRMLKSNSIQRMANQVATGLITQKAKMPTTRECHVKSASLLTHMYVALLSVLMGATDGLSLGSIIFPHDDNHPNNEYRSLGMSLGLFTAFVCNFASCVTSQIPHAVGGAVMPIIPLMAAYFQTFGTENCATVMVAIPLITVCVGLLTIASGYFKLRNLSKHVRLPSSVDSSRLWVSNCSSLASTWPMVSLRRSPAWDPMAWVLSRILLSGSSLATPLWWHVLCFWLRGSCLTRVCRFSCHVPYSCLRWFSTWSCSYKVAPSMAPERRAGYLI